MLLNESEREESSSNRAELLNAGLLGSSGDGIASQLWMSSFLIPSP
jgi:hypothetical protein